MSRIVLDMALVPANRPEHRSQRLAQTGTGKFLAAEICAGARNDNHASHIASSELPQALEAAETTRL